MAQRPSAQSRSARRWIRGCMKIQFMYNPDGISLICCCAPVRRQEMFSELIGGKLTANIKVRLKAAYDSKSD